MLITNPPFSKLTPFINHCITLRPRVICLLFGCLNVTFARMKALREAGYTLTKQHQTWWNVVCGGLVVILHFEREAENDDVTVTYDYHLHKSKAGGDGK